MNDYHAAVESRVERARQAIEQPSCCIFCHTLQVVTPEGFSYCPYERAGNHVRAKQFNVEGWLNEQSRVVSAVSSRPRAALVVPQGDRRGKARRSRSIVASGA